MANSEESFTLGAGINYELSSNLFVKFNYAYGDFGRLKNIQYFDVGLIF